jgi:putative acyltransferase
MNYEVIITRKIWMKIKFYKELIVGMNIDILRIFAFVFIVMLHTLNRQYGLTVWMSGYAVISIGVNLFIMISGYLLLDRTETVKEFFRKRFFSILPLFIIFNIIYIYFYNHSFITIKKISAPHFWYIYMILGLYLLTPWLRKVLQYAEKETFYVVVLWFLCNVFNPYMQFFKFPKIPFSHFPITGFIGYYILGYYLKKYRYKLEKIPFICVIGVYITGFLISVLSTKYVLVTTGNRISDFFDKNSLGTFFMNVSFFIFWIKFNFKNRNKIIRMISDSTYFAYLIHIIILHYVIKISDEMIFKSVATIIVSIITGILYNYIKKILDEFYKRHGTERG